MILLPKECHACNSDPSALGAAGELGRRLLYLIGRVMMTHHLPPDHLVTALEMTPSSAHALVVHGRLPHGLETVDLDRVRLFANIVQRLEHRLRHDGPAIRRVFECPLDALSGRTPAEMLPGSVDDLWRLRSAIDAIEAPPTRWYRVGH